VNPIKTTAVRLCGLATVMLIAVCAADIWAGIDLHLSVEMSLLLAVTGFLVANIRPAAGVSVALTAAAVSILMTLLHVYIVLDSPTGPGIPLFKPFIAQSPWVLGLDGLLAIAPVSGLAYLGIRGLRSAATASQS
jgi:hypothetical protein